MNLTTNFSKFVAVKLHKLFALNIWGIKNVTDEGVRLISQFCTSITSLTICECTQLTECSIIYILASLHNLVTLNLWGCTVLSNACIQLLLRHSTSLQSLEFAFCRQLIDGGLANISNCSSLKSIQLDSCSLLTDLTLNELGSSHITSMNIRKCSKMSSEAIENCLKKCSTLSILSLAHCQVSSQVITQLPFLCPALKSLDLSGIQHLKKENMQAILDSEIGSNLTVLKLDECILLPDHLIQQILNQCLLLQHLSLCFCSQVSISFFFVCGSISFLKGGNS